MLQIINTISSQPVIGDVLAEMVAGALTSTASHLFRRSERNPIENTNPDASVSLSDILKQAMADFVPSQGRAGIALDEQLVQFLRAPEVELLLRKIFVSRLTAGQLNLEELRQEFTLILSLHLRSRAGDVGGLGAGLFDSLLLACDHSLSVAASHGSLVAIDAKNEVRHKVVLGYLAAVKNNLDLLSSGRQLDITAILVFEKRLRDQMAQRHGFITPPHFDSAKKVAMDKLYVPPTIDGGGEEGLIPFEEFMKQIDRTVLLGYPGGGKSTCANKVCYTLATRYSERLVSERQLTPVLITVREYGKAKQDHHWSFVEFIEAQARSRYQLHPPDGAIEYLLQNGRLLVVFDGLDELLATNHRQEIAADVEGFGNLYPSVPVLVTSRQVGYDQAPLDDGIFKRFSLHPFEDGQIEDYVRKWFGLDTDLPDEHKHLQATTFLEQSKAVADLRANPLMLALMCNIYKGENYIPRNRPDVYEKCAVMLFERWDQGRGIHHKLPFEDHVRPAMEHLAFWIYCDFRLQDGVREAELVSKAAEYLLTWLYEDKITAERAASEFIHFCRGRAWVFTNIGSTKDDEEIYQFTHRSFLEYFTASYLTRNFPTPKRLSSFLMPKITKREWDLVAQLAFQKQHRNIAGGGDELLSLVLGSSQGRVSSQTRWNLISFAARCLEFMVPRPHITRAIATAVVNAFKDWVIQVEQGDETHSDRRSRPAIDIIGDLLRANVENRPAIADTLRNLMTDLIVGDSSSVSMAACEVIFALPGVLRDVRGSVPDRSSFEYWHQVASLVLESCPEAVLALFPKHPGLSVFGFQRDMVSLRDIVSWHGPNIIFVDTRLSIDPSRLYWSLGKSLLRFIAEATDEGSQRLVAVCRQFSQIGNVLQEYPTPWITHPSTLLYGLHLHVSPGSETETSSLLESLDSTGKFGAFAVLACAIELSDHSDEVLGIGSPLIAPWNTILGSRSTLTSKTTVLEDMAKLSLDQDHERFILKWADSSVSFVKAPKHSEIDTLRAVLPTVRRPTERPNGPRTGPVRAPQLQRHVPR